MSRCYDTTMITAIGAQSGNLRDLWDAITAAPTPDHVPEQLWAATLETEQVIASCVLAGIAGCPCPNHGGAR